jgi:hypothetical protein
MIAKFAASMVLLAMAGATPSAEYFRYQRTLTNLPPAGGQSCGLLDPAIFAHSAASLADLRLYTNGQETPYVLRASFVPAERQVLAIEPMNKGLRNGHTSFDARIDHPDYSDVSLEINARDFIATVTVWGSQMDDGSQPTRLGAYTIFDLTRQKLGRSTVLHLPTTNFLHLHFEIAGPIQPEQVTAIQMNTAVEASTHYTAVAATNAVERNGRQTVVSFTLPAHVPVDRVTIVPAAQPAQFSRSASVEVAEADPPKTDRQPLAASVTPGNLTRVHSVQNGTRIDREDLTLEAPHSYVDGSARWTITIDNGDDAPLGISQVRLEMLERKLCFDATAGMQAKLVYGDAALNAPSYDYARIFAEDKQAAQVVLGPEQVNPSYKPRPDERAFTEKHPALLWMALVASVAALGFIAFRSLPATKPEA